MDLLFFLVFPLNFTAFKQPVLLILQCGYDGAIPEPHLQTEMHESAGSGKEHVRVGVDGGELFLHAVPPQDTGVLEAGPLAQVLGEPAR